MDIPNLRQAWITSDPSEIRNIRIFIIGLMFYKFGLEIFIGSIIPLASDRFGESFFDCDESRNDSLPPGHLDAFRKVGVLTGVNLTMQCIGSIFVAPLIQRYQTRRVLLWATGAFALMTSILIIVDAATGGRPRQWGDYNPVAIFPVYCISGIAYGMIELIRRVLPRELVGGDVSKLKRLDSVVHVLYEIAGTIGPITAVKLIDSVGENFSFFLAPVSLALSGIVWFLIRPTEGQDEPALPENPTVEMTFLKRLLRHIAFWGRSTWNGGAIVFSSRRFIWLIPCYSFALLAHRYLENNIANIYAKGVIQKASYQPLIIVGSNLGELLGAIMVFFTADIIDSPMLFVRLDGLFLLLVWLIPFFPVSGNTLNDALGMAALFLPMSLTWAAGDVSLNAFIQSDLTNRELRMPGVATIASIMSFLYVTYIASYTLLSSLLGLVVDTVLGRHDACGVDFRSNTRTALIYVGGIFFTTISFMMLISSFLPGKTLAWNPPLWDVQPQQQAVEMRNAPVVGPDDVHRVDRQDDPGGVDTDDSEATEQEVAEQEVAEQEVTEQEATEQEATEQEATEQEATEQEATEQEATEQQAQPQSFLPSLAPSRPLPPLPISARRPDGAQPHSFLPSFEDSTPQPSSPFSTHGSHYP